MLIYNNSYLYSHLLKASANAHALLKAKLNPSAELGEIYPAASPAKKAVLSFLHKL